LGIGATEHRIAHRRAEEEGADALFVRERRRSSRIRERDPQRAERAIEIVVGVIERPHGVRGEVVVGLRTDEPERRFAPGQVLRQEGGTRLFTVRSVRDHSGRLLVRFAELVDRAGAEAVRGTLLVAAVDPDERPSEPGEFYDRQLIGLRATTRDGAEVGRVASVLHLPAQDLLEIETAGGPRLVPFVAALVPDIDLEAGLLTIADVAGLLDDRDDADED
jgi:16S rRNA processing protein RimM